MLAQLPDESVDLVVTSPPYNLRNSTGNGSRAWPGYDGYNDDLPHEEYVAWQRQCIAEMLRVVKPSGAIFYNHCWRVQDGLFQGCADILEGFPLRQIIIWHRSGSQNHNGGYFVPGYEVIYVIAKAESRLVDDCSDGAVWKIPQDQGLTVPDLPVWPGELPRRAIAATDAQVVLDGSVRAVFDHVERVLAANAWAPTVLHQDTIASDLALSKVTVGRAIQTLKGAGAIVVHNHGRWSTYAPGNGQLQPGISSIMAEATSAPQNEVTSAAEGEVTSARNDVTSVKNEATSAPGPGPGISTDREK